MPGTHIIDTYRHWIVLNALHFMVFTPLISHVTPLYRISLLQDVSDNVKSKTEFKLTSRKERPELPAPSRYTPYHYERFGIIWQLHQSAGSSWAQKQLKFLNLLTHDDFVLWALWNWSCSNAQRWNNNRALPSRDSSRSCCLDQSTDF